MALPHKNIEHRPTRENFESLDKDRVTVAARVTALEAAAPQARAYRSTSQSIPSGTPTAITLDQESYDLGVEAPSEHHSTSSNTSRLTCVIAGLYAIDGALLFDSTGGGDRSASIRLNGATDIVLGGAIGFTYAAAVNQRIPMSTQYRLAVGDYIELVASQASGVARNVVASGVASPYLAFARVSP